MTLNTQGGRGGDSYIGGNLGPHGPGGGGGGGVVFYANIGSPSVNISGGATGLTTKDTNDAKQQIYYGNTEPGNIIQRQAFGSRGGNGFTGTTSITLAADNPRATFNASCLPMLTVTKITNTPQPLNLPTSTATPVYQIQITNGSKDTAGAATGVQVADVLPSPFTYEGPTTYTPSSALTTRPLTANPAANATSLTWSSFTIPGGESVTLTFPINRTPTAVGTFQNSATVSFIDPSDSTGTRRVSPLTAALGGANTSYTLGGTVGGSNYASSSSTAEDIVIQSDLSVTKQAVRTGTAITQMQRRAGDSFDYLVTVKNEKAVNATGITVSDTIPAGLTAGTPTFTFLNPNTSTGTPTFSSNTLTIPALASGQSVTMRLPVTVNSGVNAASTLTNTATLTAATPSDGNTVINGSVPSNNTASVNTLLNPIQIEKRSINLGSTVPGTLPAFGTMTTGPITVKPLDYVYYCLQATSLYSTGTTMSFSDTLATPLDLTGTVASATLNGSSTSATLTVRTLSKTGVVVSSSAPQTFCFWVRVL